MKLVDANVLIYAVEESAEHHRSAKLWLDPALGASETVLLPWVSLKVLIRIVTHPRICDHPVGGNLANDGNLAALGQAPGVGTQGPAQTPTEAVQHTGSGPGVHR